MVWSRFPKFRSIAVRFSSIELRPVTVTLLNVTTGHVVLTVKPTSSAENVLSVKTHCKIAWLGTGASVTGTCVSGGKVVGKPVVGCAVDGTPVVVGCAVEGTPVVVGCAVEGTPVVVGCEVEGTPVGGGTAVGNLGRHRFPVPSAVQSQTGSPVLALTVHVLPLTVAGAKQSALGMQLLQLKEGTSTPFK
jgi:hypothetical protein